MIAVEKILTFKFSPPFLIISLNFKEIHMCQVVLLIFLNELQGPMFKYHSFSRLQYNLRQITYLPLNFLICKMGINRLKALINNWVRFRMGREQRKWESGVIRIIWKSIFSFSIVSLIKLTAQVKVIKISAWTNIWKLEWEIFVGSMHLKRLGIIVTVLHKWPKPSGYEYDPQLYKAQGWFTKAELCHDQKVLEETSPAVLSLSLRRSQTDRLACRECSKVPNCLQFSSRPDLRCGAYHLFART